MYLKTNQFHIAQFAYLTQRMKEINEGETSLLDNSILMLHVEPVRRRRPRRQPAADPAHRQGRRHAQDRPHPRLPGQGRREPQGVQPAPLADGPHGRASSIGSATRRRAWKSCRPKHPTPARWRRNAGAPRSARGSVSRRGKTAPPRPVLTIAAAARAITSPVNNQFNNEAT